MCVCVCATVRVLTVRFSIAQAVRLVLVLGWSRYFVIRRPWHRPSHIHSLPGIIPYICCTLASDI